MDRPFQRIAYFILISTCIVVLILMNYNLVQADSPADWHPPEWIPGLVDSGLDPCFVIDAGGKIHVFHSQSSGNDSVILYSNFAVGVGWMEPVDIIFSDGDQIQVSGAFFDESGMINLIYWAGNELHAGIYYSKASIVDAKRAMAWSAPVLIGRNAIAPTTVSVVNNQQGGIVLVYGGNDEGNGLYSVVSNDYGQTWSLPRSFYLTNSEVQWPSALQMLLDADEMVHAVWVLSDESGNGQRIYYASLTMNEGEWNTPTILAQSFGYEADTPSIIEFNQELIVVFHNDFPTTRYMTVSSDHGESWTTPIRLFELVGSNGAADFAIDSNNILHMFFGNRDDETLRHGVWHSEWKGDHWSTPVAIVSGPQVNVNEMDEEGFDPSNVQVFVSQGNLLMVVWRHDPTAGPKHIWYSYQYLDTPKLPTQAISYPTPTSLIIPTNISNEEVIGTGNYAFSQSETPISTSQLFLLSITSVALLMILVFINRSRHRR